MLKLEEIICAQEPFLRMQTVAKRQHQIDGKGLVILHLENPQGNYLISWWPLGLFRNSVLLPELTWRIAHRLLEEYDLKDEFVAVASWLPSKGCSFRGDNDYVIVRFKFDDAANQG